MPQTINMKKTCVRKKHSVSWAFKTPFPHHRSQGARQVKLRPPIFAGNQRAAINCQPQRASGFTLLDGLAGEKITTRHPAKNTFRRHKPRAPASRKAFHSPRQLQKLGWPENELHEDDPHVLRFKIIRLFSMLQASDLTHYNIYPSEQESRIKLSCRDFKYEEEPIARVQSPLHLKPP